MAGKKIRERADLLFFQHPFRLEDDERIVKLKRRLGFEGMGIFWEVYRKIRLCKGQYPLDSILLMAGGKESKVKKISRVLTEFDLFVVNMDMVSMGTGLTVKSFKDKGDSNKELQAKVDELSERTYEDTLMPKELAEMDSRAKESLQTEIRKNNVSQVNQLLDFV